MNELEFSRLEEVDENTFKDCVRALIVSRLAYKNAPADTETQLMLESFVDGHPVLKGCTANVRGHKRYFCDKAFFGSLKKYEESRRGGLKSEGE